MLGELIDLISGIALNERRQVQGRLGRVYEYFWPVRRRRSAAASSIRRAAWCTLVEMIEPYQGRVYDPCCGSGGMFVQSEKFVDEHGGRIGDIAIYGQESNYTTWRLCKMNLAVRGIDSDIRWNNEGSFHKDELRDLKADFILANPPFNISDWGGERLRDDALGLAHRPRAMPTMRGCSTSSITSALTAGVVLANGSMSSQQSGEGEIRKAMIEAGAVDCMWRCPASCSIPRRFQLACGSWRKTAAMDWSRTVGCVIGAVKSCSSTRATWACWWTGPGVN